MNEMIEKVAKAIYEAENKKWNYKDLAKAAIAAMREPTEGMMKASLKTGGRKHLWYSMIDAALKD